MSALEEIIAGYQWLVIPQGVENNELTVTVRVVPLLSKDYFKRRGTDDLHIRDLDFARLGEATDPVIDWPTFVRRIKGFELGFAEDSTDTTPKPFTEGSPPLAARDASADRDLRSDLWRAMFTLDLLVMPQEEPGKPSFRPSGSSAGRKLLPPMPHASGADILRSEVGRAHVHGLLDHRRPRDLQDTKRFAGAQTSHAGVVVSRYKVSHGGAVQELAKLMAGPGESRAEAIRRIRTSPVPNSDAAERDFDRMFAVGPRSLLNASTFLATSTRNPLAISAPPPGSPDALKDFLLQRTFAVAPDLPTLDTAKKRMAVRLSSADKESDPKIDDKKKHLPEFHRDLGKAVSHPWLIKALGLSIKARVKLPANWDRKGSLYVQSVVYGIDDLPDRKFAPRTQFQTSTGKHTSSRAAWRPFPVDESESGLYVDGMLRLNSLVSANRDGLVPAFVLEQLDIDSATEKLMHVVQTLSSQFEAGVIPEKREATLSTLRTTGMSMLMRTSAQMADAQTRRREKVRTNAHEHGCARLFADDLIVGFRPDVCTLEPDVRGGFCVAKWKSLTRRKLTNFEIDGRSFNKGFGSLPEDEAFVTPHGRLLDALEGPEDKSRRLPFEEFFCWRGWNLSVPQVEVTNRRRDADAGVPDIKYEASAGHPKQRFGWGYLLRARVVYVDGSSWTLNEADTKFASLDELTTLGSPVVGAAKWDTRRPDSNRFFAPFLRYEPVQPARVSATRTPFERASTERDERMLITSNGHGRVIQPKSRRELSAPLVDLDCAIRAGMYDTAAARRSRPRSGLVPDPWAKRMIIGIYRKGDGALLRMEYFDYYDAEHVWPKARTLNVDLVAENSETLPAQGFLTSWNGDTYTVRVAAGVSLEIKHWHEMSKEQLSASGIVEAMARWLTLTPTDQDEKDRIARAKKDLGIGTLCTDYCDMRDELIKVIAQWHEQFPYDLRPYFTAGRPARDVALTSFSMLNPASTIEMVHAVPIPAREPVFSQADLRLNKRKALLPMVASEVARRFNIERNGRGNTTAEFRGDIEIHRSSTERVDCFGQWEDVVDDPSKNEPTSSVQTHLMFRVENLKGVLKPLANLAQLNTDANGAVVATTIAQFDVPPDNDLLMLDQKREALGRHENEDFNARVPHYDFGDAKARLIDFELRAVSRYANDFPNQTHYRDCKAAESRWLEATLPPAKPEVAFIVPLFDKEDKEVGTKFRRRRSGGWFRIWLERPWFTSGQGELLALVCAPGNLFRARGGAKNFLTDGLERAWGSITEAAELPPRFRPSEQLQRLYTGWGLDPIWSQPGAKLFFIPPGAFANRIIPDLPKPVLPSQFVGLKGVPSKDLEVSLALYKPEFDKTERRWFVDIQIQPDDRAYFPFVRLGLARYQPNADDGCELSEIVSSEFVQLTPERSATVTVEPVKGLHRVRVEIVGPAPATLHAPEIPNLQPRMVMRVDRAVGDERRDAPQLWEPMISKGESTTEEAPLSYSANSRRWSGYRDYDLRKGSQYSIYLEEHEPMLVDAQPDSTPSAPPIASSRVIYADRIPLPGR